MPVLPEEVLEKLICSFCKKFLSVFPVKVYPNKNVKCGRCCENDDDGGTISRLYDLVGKQLKFPCVNRYEGCREVLFASDMEKHENSCYSDEYTCPVCTDFIGSSYGLLYHMKINHKKAALENNAFLIELDQGSTSEIYFYCKNSFFLIVRYQYDATIHQIILNLDIFGKHRTSQQNIMHKFLLYSVQSKLQYKTGNRRSSENEVESRINLLTDKFPKNIIFCKFEVWDSPLVLAQFQHIKEYKHKNVQSDLPQILDGFKDNALLKFRFNNISTLDAVTYTYSDLKYYVGGILWEAMIKKHNKNEEYLSLFLKRNELSQKCKVDALYTLVSETSSKCYEKSYMNVIFGEDYGYNLFIKWSDLLEPDNKYVKDDSIEIQIFLRVLPVEEGKCNKCSQTCTRCN